MSVPYFRRKNQLTHSTTGLVGPRSAPEIVHTKKTIKRLHRDLNPCRPAQSKPLYKAVRKNSWGQARPSCSLSNSIKRATINRNQFYNTRNLGFSRAVWKPHEMGTCMAHLFRNYTTLKGHRNIVLDSSCKCNECGIWKSGLAFFADLLDINYGGCDKNDKRVDYVSRILTDGTTGGDSRPFLCLYVSIRLQLRKSTKPVIKSTILYEAYKTQTSDFLLLYKISNELKPIILKTHEYFGKLKIRNWLWEKICNNATVELIAIQSE